jgi:hypothetical protein
VALSLLFLELLLLRLAISYISFNLCTTDTRDTTWILINRLVICLIMYPIPKVLFFCLIKCHIWVVCSSYEND